MPSAPVADTPKVALSPPVAPLPRPVSNWEAFTQARLIPAEIVCSAYQEAHSSDNSCHTRLLLQTQTMLQHYEAGHGGGFEVRLVPLIHGKSHNWAGWQAFIDSGLEVMDLTCGVCNQHLPLVAQQLLIHMRPHRDGNRRVHRGGAFKFTIGHQIPITDIEDAPDAGDAIAA